MILTKHEETKKGRLFHENEKLRIFVSSCSINYLYQVVFLSSLSKKFFLIPLTSLLFLTACTNCGNRTDEQMAQVAQQRYDEACQANDMNRTLAVIDSMEKARIISTAKADNWRAFAYDRGWQRRIAEHYYRKAYEGYRADLKPQNYSSYADAGFRWAYLRSSRGDTEGALGVITDLLGQAEDNQDFPKSTESALTMLMAHCYLQLHQWDACRRSCQKAYEIQKAITDDKADDRFNLTITCMNISSFYFDMGDVEGAQQWLERCEQAFDHYQQVGDSMLIEEYKGHIALEQARYLQATGHADEAAATYAAVPHTRIFEAGGYTEAADYLMAAGRYDEAAYWYEQIDSTYIATDGAQMTFDIIASRLSPRYTAYRKAGRNDDALVIADNISAAIDSALAWQKQNDAAELAVVYQTHERDLQLTNLRFKVSLHRVMAVALVIILLLIGYLLWRSRKYNRVLAKKNQHLYEQMKLREQAIEEERKALQAQPEDSLTSAQQLFRQLCTLMDERQPYIDETLNRDTLAQMLGTNAKYVVQAIRECSHGETVTDFITRYRLENVARLLKTTDDPISLIGELSGIPSRATLARLFRNTYGTTCSEFRQAARAEAVTEYL